MSQWSGSEQVRRLTSSLRAHRPRSWWHAAGVGLVYLLGWAVIAVPVAYHAFMTDERATVIAGHDVVVSPTRDGWATFDLGAFLPDVRYPTDPLGVTVDVGATKLDDYNALIQRYAVIASQPEGEVAKVSELLTDMAFDAMAFGAVVGLAGPALWLLLGSRRRRELLRALTTRRAMAGRCCGRGRRWGDGVTSVFLEDDRAEDSVAGSHDWQPIGELITERTISGPEARLQIQGGLMTSGTKSADPERVRTYDTSVTFYRDLAERAAAIGPELRQPSDDETVASSSPTGTTTSAWTRSRARSATQAGRRCSSTAATTPPRASHGRPSVSTRSPRRSTATSSSSPSRATMTTVGS